MSLWFNYIEDGFWIQMLGLCCMIVCIVSMIVLAQYSTLCLLLNGFSVALSTKQNFLSTFISQVSPESLKRDLLLCWSQHFGPLLHDTWLTWLDPLVSFCCQHRGHTGGLPWLLDCSELQLFMKFVSAPKPDNKWMFLFFFGESNRPGARSPLLRRKGFSYLPGRQTCAARSSDLSEEQSSIHLCTLGTKTSSGCPVTQKFKKDGMLWDIFLTGNKSTKKRSQAKRIFLRTPWSERPMRSYGDFVACRLVFSNFNPLVSFSLTLKKSFHFVISFLFDPRSCFESHFVSVRLGHSKWS